MITEYTWRRLRDGERVWVFAPWMKFPMPGIVRHEKTKRGRPKRKCVYINFFGDCQTYWRPSDRKKFLEGIYLNEQEAKGAAFRRDGTDDDLHG